MEKGTINVQTENIFPIIKKFLYSDHEIFLRELVSNAMDATEKVKKLAILGDVKQELGDLTISVSIDKEAKTLTIEDKGIGMTAEEVNKYINQIAFSSAEEFLEKFKKVEDKTTIIGHFGLGFYSAFMVADKVEIESLSMTEGAEATKWTCEGDTEYAFSSSDKSEIGTEITLFINEESKDFLDAWKTRQTLTQYCDFMPYPIFLKDLNEIARITAENAAAEKEEDKKPLPNTDQINDTTPLWKKDPATLKDEDYKNFYRKLFPMDPEPLFWLHLNVDHPFTLQGVLFFPKLNPNKPVNDANIKLYCKQVFVSDNVKDVIPEFLGLLKGAIDSTDIPLNVSRSALQGDPNIKKISNYIVKKVAESLKKLYKNEREKYESAWEDIGLFVKYGVVSDPKFDELMRDKVLFKNSDQKFVTLSEYTESIPEKHQEKLKGKVVYFEENVSDSAVREQLKAEGVQAISTDSYIDPHFMQHTEMQKQGETELKYQLVDNAIEDVLEMENATEDDMKIKDLFVDFLVGKKDENDPSQMEIEIKNFKNSTTAAYFKVDEQMKRFANMTKQMGNSQLSMPTKKTLVLNPSHTLVQNTMKLSQNKKDLAGKMAHHIQDLAAISGEGLDEHDRQNFVSRSQELMSELSNLAL